MTQQQEQQKQAIRVDLPHGDGKYQYVWRPTDSGSYWINTVVFDWGQERIYASGRYSSDTTHTCYHVYGHDSEYDLPQETDGRKLRAFLESAAVQDRAAEVLAGYSTRTDRDGNTVAEFTGDAQDAKDELADLFDEDGGLIPVLIDGGGEWSALDWFSYSPEHVAPDATDEWIKARVKVLQAEADGQDVYIIGLEDYLIDRRRWAAREEVAAE